MKYEDQPGTAAFKHDPVTVASKPVPRRFDAIAHLYRQASFSAQAFGPLENQPAARQLGVLDHMRKEMVEVEADLAAGRPTLGEWVDLIILATDGALHSGASPEEVCAAWLAKQVKNEGRTWPDWRTADPAKAIEHVRTEEESNVTAR